MRLQLVKEKCPRAFQFLVEQYGFQHPKVYSDEHELRHVWLSARSGIELVYDIREEGVYLYLHRLLHGRIPVENEDPDAPLNYFSIEDVLEVRDPDADLEILNPDSELSAPRFEEILGFLAKNLKAHCEDVLRGQFRVFEQLEAIERQRRVYEA